MDDRKIRDKYGGKLPKAINRAIRAEVPGGNKALDTLTELAGAARHSGWKDRAGRNTPEAAAYFRHKKEVIDRMDAEVRKRWGVPLDLGKEDEDDKPRREKPARGAKPAAARAGKPALARGSRSGPPPARKRKSK